MTAPIRPPALFSANTRLPPVADFVFDPGCSHEALPVWAAFLCISVFPA